MPPINRNNLPEWKPGPRRFTYDLFVNGELAARVMPVVPGHGAGKYYFVTFVGGRVRHSTLEYPSRHSHVFTVKLQAEAFIKEPISGS